MRKLNQANKTWKETQNSTSTIKATPTGSISGDHEYSLRIWCGFMKRKKEGSKTSMTFVTLGSSFDVKSRSPRHPTSGNFNHL